MYDYRAIKYAQDKMLGYGLIAEVDGIELTLKFYNEYLIKESDADTNIVIVDNNDMQSYIAAQTNLPIAVIEAIFDVQEEYFKKMMKK